LHAYIQLQLLFTVYRTSRDTLCQVQVSIPGPDLELMKTLPTSHLWTVVDGDDGDQWILTGIHTVNRVCYLVTEVAHDWKELEFRIPVRGYPLTELGLLRQRNKLDRFMAAS